MGSPKVSVIVPVYNVEGYVGRCLESLKNQSLTELEILCIDDQSTDASWTVLQACQERDARIVLLKNVANGGLSYTRNQGIARAHGQYLYFLDSDDWITVDCLERLYSIAERAALDVVYFDSACVRDGALTPVPSLHRITDGDVDFRVVTGRTLFQIFAREQEHVMMAWACFMRRQFVVEYGLGFYEGIWYEDQLFYLQAILQAKRVTYLPALLHVYRYRPDSITMQEANSERLKGFLVIFCELQAFVERLTLLPEELPAVQAYIGSVYERLTGTYEKLSRLGRLMPISFRDSAHETAYRLFCWQMERGGELCRHFTEAQLQALRGFERIILYGAGAVARSVMRQLDIQGVRRFCLAVTRSEQDLYVMGNQVRALADFAGEKEQSLILLAVMTESEYREEMLRYAQGLGFLHIMVMQGSQWKWIDE